MTRKRVVCFVLLLLVCLFVVSLYLLQYLTTRKVYKGEEEALFTWTNCPSESFNVIWLVKKHSPSRFLLINNKESTVCKSKLERVPFYSKRFLLRSFFSDLWNARFTFPSMEEVSFDICKVSLNGLKSNEVYHVSVGDRKFSVCTLPKERPDRINFVTGGDMMHSVKLLEGGINAMVSRSPDFALLGGDLAYANGEDYRNWLDWISCYSRNAKNEDGYSIPFVVAIGNHEVNGGYGKTPKEAPMFYNFFPFPQN